MTAFKSAYGEFMREMRANHADNVAKIEDELYNQIVDASVVATGAYRANHNRSTGAPDYFFDKTHTFGEAPPPPLPSNIKDLVFYIANGAPYANRLENGWSDRRPNGIYKIAFNSVKSRFRL